MLDHQRGTGTSKSSDFYNGSKLTARTVRKLGSTLEHGVGLKVAGPSYLKSRGNQLPGFCDNLPGAYIHPRRFLTQAMELPTRLPEALGLARKVGPITALHVFDFDGTLVRTPGPEEGKARYQALTGRPWRGGWWGRPDSLSPPVLDSPCPPSRVIRTAFDELEEVVTRSETSVGVVVTGRIKPLRASVLRILDEITAAAKNDTVPEGQPFLHHDAVFTHPGGRLRTLEFKRLLFRTLLTSEPLRNCSINQLHIWEDRKEHAEVFATEVTDELRELTGVSTTVHFVPEGTP